jgi:hypothetical protein
MAIESQLLETATNLSVPTIYVACLTHVCKSTSIQPISSRDETTTVDLVFNGSSETSFNRAICSNSNSKFYY